MLKPSFVDLVGRNMHILSSTRRYDKHFKEYGDRFIPHIDWRYLKSLCYVESALRPEVVSGAGAIGLCQFMPGTFEQYRKSFNDTSVPTDPKYSIKYAAAHTQYLLNFWRSPRPEEDRLKLSTASYNAGQGRLLQAQRLCKERNGVAVLYKDIIICLLDITGPSNSQETINHVIRVWQNWYALAVVGN